MLRGHRPGCLRRQRRQHHDARDGELARVVVDLGVHRARAINEGRPVADRLDRDHESRQLVPRRRRDAEVGLHRTSQVEHGDGRCADAQVCSQVVHEGRDHRCVQRRVAEDQSEVAASKVHARAENVRHRGVRRMRRMPRSFDGTARVVRKRARVVCRVARQRAATALQLTRRPTGGDGGQLRQVHGGPERGAGSFGRGAVNLQRHEALHEGAEARSDPGTRRVGEAATPVGVRRQPRAPAQL
mmetsp:Transcript_54715/g.168541  ORF Transcript_54715/g.168541 Transcript_54715/m.168541 type:complete len:243 (-) Transcript_54715:188-916(-)